MGFSTIFKHHIIYSVPTNFCLKLIEPNAREVEGQLFFSSDAVSSLARFEPCSLLLSSLAPSLLSLGQSPKNKYLADSSKNTDDPQPLLQTAL